MAFDWGEMWTHMGGVARGVLITLGIMSVWSAGIAVERLMRFAAAVKESALFAGASRPWMAARQFSEVVAAQSRFACSPLSNVVTNAVREYHDGVAAQAQGATYDVIEAAERA